jgi:hypothetical protein
VSAAAHVAAFDPGRNVGFALVAADGRRLDAAVFDVADLSPERLRARVPDGVRVVVGAGTGAARVSAALEAAGRPAELVDEVGTSLEGRDLWRRCVPPRGFARWLPAGLRVPSAPIDDYAAWAIALRVLGVASEAAPGPTDA